MTADKAAIADILVPFLVAAFYSALMDTTRISVVLMITGSVLVIFLLVHLFAWFKDSIESMKMNQALVELQKQVE